LDAAMISQHTLGIAPLSGNQILIADVSGNGIITSFDAALIAGYVVNLPDTGTTGNWIFNPVNRSYTSVTSDITGQDYTALLMGEVSGDWANTGSRSANSGGPERSTAVKLPHLATPADNEVIIPVSVRGAANKGIISYEFNLRYDPSVIQPETSPVDLGGTVSSRLSVAVNAREPGLLRVAVYGPVALDKNGVLLNLRFTAVGKPGSVSPITWERIMFNEGEPIVSATDGVIELSAGILAAD